MARHPRKPHRRLPLQRTDAAVVISQSGAGFKRREDSASKRAPRRGALMAQLRTAAQIPGIVRGRTANFIRHYWQLFQFARAHVGMMRILQIAALDLTATAARAGVLFLAAILAAIMEGRGPQLPGFDVVPLSNQTLAALLLISIPILALLLYSSLAAYWAARSMRRCARTTQTELLRHFLAHVPWLDSADLSGVIDSPGQLKQLLARDVRQSGMSLEMILRLIQPIFYIVLALATIFYLEPVLSALIIALGLVIAPLLYLLSRRIQKNAQAYYQWQRAQMGRAISELVDRIDTANAGQASRIEPDWIDKQPAVTNYLDAFDRHKLASSQMGFTSSMLRSIFVVCGVLAFGWLAIEGERSWETLVIYIGGLLFLATGAQSFFVTLTQLIKFYPQTRTVAVVMERLKATRESAPAPPRAPPSHIALRARPEIAGSDTRRTIAKGELAVLFAGKPLRRHSFRAFLRPLQRAANGVPGDFWLTAAFLRSGAPLPEGKLVTAVLGQSPPADKLAWLEALLREALGDDYSRYLPAGLDTELTAEGRHGLPARITALLQLASVCAEARGALFISSEIAAKVPADVVSDIPRRAEGAPYVFVVCDDVDMPVTATHYLVADDRALIGLGDARWFADQHDAIAAHLSTQRGADDEDDEMMDSDDDE